MYRYGVPPMCYASYRLLCLPMHDLSMLWQPYSTMDLIAQLWDYVAEGFFWCGWVGSPITWPDLSPEISKLPQLSDFCHLVEWVIQLPYLICHIKSANYQNYPIFLTWLSGRSNYPTWFATWNLQFAKITRFLSPGWVDDPITLPDLPPETFKLEILPNFCYLVEWAIQLPNMIYQLISPHCHNSPICVTWLSGQSNYLAQFLSPDWVSNPITHFATWNLQIAKITSFLSPSWVGNPITWPDLPPETFKLAKLPNFCCLVEWAIQLPNMIYQLISPHCHNYPIFVTWLSGQSNYLTQFLSPDWVGDPITLHNLPPEISKLPKLPNFSHPVEQVIQLPYPICHLKSPNCQNYLISLTWLSGQSNYLTQCATSNIQIPKITWFLLPDGVGHPITQANLPTEVSKLPKLPNFSHPVEWTI